MSEKRVLITGCNGFIGSKVASYFIEKNFKVYGVDISGSINRNTDVEVKYCDLEKDEMVQIYKDISPSVFIHCAGNASVGISVKSPQLDFHKNVGVLYKTLSELNNAGVNPRFIFLSSAAVYGNPKVLPVTEATPRVPISPYGLHKKMCEDLCFYYNEQNNFDIKVVRIFSAFGEGLRKQILWDMHCKLKAYGELQLFGTGDETRDFIHIDDVTRAIHLLAETKDRNVVYNLACGEETSIRNLAETYVESYGMDKSLIGFNGIVKEGDPLNWRADISRLKSLGFERQVSLSEGIGKYINWVKGV